MTDKESKTGSLRDKSRTETNSSTSEKSSSSSDFGSIGKYKKDKRKTGTVNLDIRSKSLKKEKKEKKEKRLSDTDPPKRHSSETGHVPKTELNVTITTIVEQPTKLETSKLDSRYYRKSTDVECQIIFYDDNFNTVLKLVDSEEDSGHWEFMLQKGGGSVNRLDTMRKQKKYLSSIASVYEREVSESKYGLLRFISENILKGTKRTYLNYLVDHHTISVTYSQVVDSTISNNSSTTPTITKPRHSISDSLGIESLKVVGHRRSQSVANRNPSRRTSVSRASFASNDANYSSMPQSGIRTPLIQVNGVQDDSSSGNSSKGGTGVSQHSLENSSSSKYNTLKEEDDQLQYTLENLLKEERFLEARECIKFLKSQDELKKLNVEYEKAKSEDLLHEAIIIRDKIKAIKDFVTLILNDPLIMDSWNGKPPSNHKTLQQIHEYIIDRVGTKLALPFIEEFADINLTIIAKDDLEKAISLQQKAVEKLLVLAPPLSDEEEREKKKKEEEERWRKEAEEKKKKKKKDRESTLRQLSESTADLLSNSADPVIVPIVDNHK